MRERGYRLLPGCLMSQFDSVFVCRGLTSVFLCLVFLVVNILAYSGIVKSNSWVEKHPNTSYKLLYPWICLYFIANCAILPVGEEFLTSHGDE